MNMKKLVFIILLGVFMMIPIIGSFTKGINYTYTRKAAPSKNIKKSHILETLTIYHPTVKQCDSTPLITASNARINVEKLYKQELRWIALSRDLLKRWKGDFNYGDTIVLASGDSRIDGLWIIQDNLNKKYKNRGDLLFDSRVRKLGKWNNVKISKL
jgi:hypothetical protein